MTGKLTKTKDFGLASLLVAKKANLLGYTTDEYGNLWFEFATDQMVTDLEQGFFRNTVDVRVQDFLAAQKMLKTLIFETKRNGHEYGNNTIRNLRASTV